jgi:hypothetical protein
MKDNRNQHVGQHPAYSLNLIINSDHPGLLDSSGQYIAPSLFSFEENGVFIPGYPGIYMGRPDKNSEFLFTVRDVAGDKKLEIDWWEVTLRAHDEPNPPSPLKVDFPLSSNQQTEPAVGKKTEKSYCEYTLFKTQFKDKKDIPLKAYRFTMRLRIVKQGTILPFASDPEMIIDDDSGIGLVKAAARV